MVELTAAVQECQECFTCADVIVTLVQLLYDLDSSNNGLILSFFSVCFHGNKSRFSLYLTTLRGPILVHSSMS